MIVRALATAAVGIVLGALSSCAAESPEQGSQTNWLSLCETSDDCGDLECLCGVCTVTCSDGAQCSELGFGACVPAVDDGAIALCDGQVPSGALCLPSCDAESCPEGTSCVAGACVPALGPTAHVEIEPASRFQALIGFGASLAYDEEFIVTHPDKEALFDAMFLESGLDMIRLRNHFDGADTSGLAVTAEILSEAEARLGRPPTSFLTSGSPPASLKANGARFCGSSDATCTLVRAADGRFDYAGFAEYWRASLEAYEAVGIHPDFVSIQNNPDYIPPPNAPPIEACRFLPEEGTTTITGPDGQSVDAAFPGYTEALTAVSTAVGTLPSQYEFVAPEAGSVVVVGGYSAALDPSLFGALAFHLYGTQDDALGVEQLGGLRAVAEAMEKPVIQSEMASDALGTAVLVHHTLTAGGGAAYLQQPFVSATTNETSASLIGLDGASIRRLPVYHALAHFARTTDPGWRRVAASSDSDVLASAWLSPDASLMTVVLVNPTDVSRSTEVTVPDASAALLDKAGVTRTTFDGVERSVDLGRLSERRVVRVPARSIVTVATLGD